MNATDLNDALRHAFLTGFNAARSGPNVEDGDGPAYWVGYIPQKADAFAKLSPLTGEEVREALERESDCLASAQRHYSELEGDYRQTRVRLVETEQALREIARIAHGHSERPLKDCAFIALAALSPSTSAAAPEPTAQSGVRVREAPKGCPPVGTVCGISGANSDYNDKWTYTDAKVIAYTPDGQFGWFQKDGCWPWQERLSNCRFRAALAAPATEGRS
jgi:hypothetical protein